MAIPTEWLLSTRVVDNFVNRCVWYKIHEFNLNLNKIPYF